LVAAGLGRRAGVPVQFRRTGVDRRGVT
jgi:hypothetical protein